MANQYLSKIKIPGITDPLIIRDTEAHSLISQLNDDEKVIAAALNDLENKKADKAYLNEKADKATTLAGYGIIDAYTKSETYTKTLVNGLVDTPHQEYVTVDTYSSLPAIGSKDTIYRVSNYNGSTGQIDASVYSEYAWDGSQYTFLCVKSQIGEVFDISVYNNNTKYADLAAALDSNNGGGVPQSLQKGGMSVKFVQSSDNNYVQFFCNSQTFTTNVIAWEKTNLEKELNERTLFIDTYSIAFTKENKKFILPNGDIISYDDTAVWISSLVDISSYKRVKITASSKWANCIYAFYNSDESTNSVYRSESAATYLEDEEVIIPSGAKYIRISGLGTTPDMNISAMVEKNAVNELQNEIDDIKDITSIPSKSLPLEFVWSIRKAINGINGVIGDVGDSDYKVGYYIPVIAGEKYYITGNSNWGNAIYALYDNNKAFVSALRSENTSAGSGIVDELITIPEGASYICLSCKGKYNMAINKQRTSPKREFDGKKWGAVGDSLTDVGAATQIHYFDYIAQKTGIIPINYGISGTGYAKTSPFYERVSSMVDDVDVITAFGSGNDNGAGLTLGEPTDMELTTLCGYINKFITEVKAKFPTKPLGIISPTPWSGSEPSNTNADAQWFANYTNALKEICALRGIPFLDIYHSSQLHPSDAAFRNLLFSKDGTYTSATESTPNAIQVTSESLISVRTCGLLDAEIGDWVLPNLSGVHPNEIGHKLIASQICSFIESLVI